jgi:hypothetical protein
MNTFIELANSRYSVRKYNSKPIPAEVMSQVLEAGRIAPTGCNNQPQRIKVITSAEELAKVDACTPCRFVRPPCCSFVMTRPSAGGASLTANPAAYRMLAL